MLLFVGCKGTKNSSINAQSCRKLISESDKSPSGLHVYRKLMIKSSLFTFTLHFSLAKLNISHRWNLFYPSSG